jgi:hypothetical protein
VGLGECGGRVNVHLDSLTPHHRHTDAPPGTRAPCGPLQPSQLPQTCSPDPAPVGKEAPAW